MPPACLSTLTVTPRAACLRAARGVVPGRAARTGTGQRGRAAEGVVPLLGQDAEGRVLQARFSRPSDILSTWEAQGTAAAELAREDYTLRHWVRRFLFSPFAAALRGCSTRADPGAGQPAARWALQPCVQSGPREAPNPAGRLHAAPIPIQLSRACGG